MSLKFEEVTKSIQLAFKGVKLGKGMSIRQCIAIDNYMNENDPEFDSIKVYDNWQDIPDEQIHCVGTHGLFTYGGMEGALFHLPRAMIYILNTYQGFLNPDGVWNVLGSIVDLIGKSEFRSQLNDDQLCAIKTFFVVVLEKYDDLVGLEDDIKIICRLI